MKNARILLVEDDENLGFVLQESLEMNGFRLTRATDGQAGLDVFQSDSFDLCLLDVMMPNLDGFSLARAILEYNPDTPIIFLTAKSMKEDRIEGLRLGADDYITKPFSMEELILRIQAVLKRAMAVPTPVSSGPRSIGSYDFDPEKQLLTLRDDSRKLTHKEAALLDRLSSQPGQLMRRDETLTAIWGEDTFFTGRSMDVYISRLRKALKEDPDVEIINVHGEGYKLIAHSTG